MTNQEGEIRIYVACLAAYNNGILHGAWINADQSAEDLQAGIQAMLKASPIKGAEEWAIHDYEGFEGARIEEYCGVQYVADLAAFIQEHGALGAALIDHYGDMKEALSAINDRYAGEYESVADFAQSITEDQCGDLPESLRFYIDYDAMARDLEINDIIAIETGFQEVHIFWNH